MATNRICYYFVILFSIFQLRDFSVAASNDALPKTIVPKLYHLTVLIEKGFYSVNQAIDLEVQQVSPSISLHASPTLKINWNKVILAIGTVALPVKDFSFNNNVVKLSFGRNILVGNYSLKIDFENKIPLKAINGIFVSPNSHNILTRFQPNLTHNVFPCFDEPHFKAKFMINIHHSKEYTALSNVQQADSSCSTTNQLCITQFPESNDMAPSSFGFSLTLDKAYTRTINSINYRIFGPIEHKDTAYAWAINYSSNALETANKWFGRAYQLTKIDFQSVKTLSTKNDNSWGLINIRDPFLYFNTNNILDVPIGIHQTSAQVISDGILSSWLEHELTPSGDEAILLNRGLSTYIQYLIIDQLKPDWRFMDQFIVRELQRSIANTTLELDTISDLETSTAASASIVRMIASTVGSKVFQNAIQRYLNASSTGVVLPAHLFNAIQTEINKEKIKLPATVEKIFGDWFTTGENVPSLNVSRRYDNNSSTANITHVGTASSKFIPIAFATAAKKAENILWLSPNSASIQSFEIDAKDNEWVLINNQATGGYYRILYDDQNWKLLAEQLKSKNYESIHVLNRAQLIDDAAHFAQNGLLSYDVLFDLLTYLTHERDLIPWASAQKSINFLDRMLRGHKVHRHFEELVRNITNKLYPEFSINNQSQQNHTKRLQRLSIAKLACEAGERQCINEIDKAAQNILDKTKYVIPEMQEMIFCAASRFILKPKSKLEQLLNNYIMGMIQNKNRTDDASITRAANGLGCTRHADLIKKSLSMTTMVIPPVLQMQIRASDRQLLFNAVAVGSYAGTKEALKFINRNFRKMRDTFLSLATVFDTIGPFINSQELRNLLDEIIKSQSNQFTDELKLAVYRAKANASKNIEWMQKHEDSISKWLFTNIEVTDDSGTASLTVNLVLVAAVTLYSIFLRN